MSRIYTILSYLVIVMVVTKCTTDKEVQFYSNQGRVIVDSSARGKEFLPIGQDDNGAYYPVYYLGRQLDTLSLGRQPISMFSTTELDNRYDSARNWNSMADLDIEVFVDTTMALGHNITYSHYSDDNERAIIDSVKSVKSFPVFITNKSDSLIMLGSHNFVGYLTREVQDKDGEWIEIEHTQTDLCGTVKRSLIMEPGDVMVAKLLRYKGDTKVSSRLKLNIKFGKVEAYKTYSNIYEEFFDLDN